MAVLPHHLPWFIVGALIGLLPVTLYAVANRPLGASGAYLQAILAVRGLRGGLGVLVHLSGARARDGLAAGAGCCGLRPTRFLMV